MKGLVIDKNEMGGNKSSSRKGVEGMLSDLSPSSSIKGLSQYNSIGQLSQQTYQPDENPQFHSSHDPVPYGHTAHDRMLL